MARAKMHHALPFFCGQACAKTIFSLQEGPYVVWRGVRAHSLEITG